MKKTSLLNTLGIFCLLFISFGAVTRVQAASPAPPGQISYQGFLVNSSGTPLGNTAPENFTVIFRIYDAPRDGTKGWSEQQTVTVDKGHFSVLLGAGGEVSGEASLWTNNLTAVFTGPTASDRYIGMTVGAEQEMAPRLQFLTSPYSFLANVARQIVRPDGTVALVTDARGRLGLGTSTPAAQLEIRSDTNAATPMLTLRNNARSESASSQLNFGFYRDVDPAFVGASIEAKSVDLIPTPPNDRLAYGAHLLFKTTPDLDGPVERMRITTGGNVGIGTTNPATKLDVHGDHSTALIRLHSTGDGVNKANLNLWASEPGWTYTGVGIGNNVRPSLDFERSGVTFRNNTNAGGSYVRFLDSWMQSVLINPKGEVISVLDFDHNGSLRLGPVSAANNKVLASFTGTTNTDYLLVLYHPLDPSWSYSFGRGGDARKIGGGSFTALSDERTKHNIKDLNGALEQLLKLRSVTFEYNNPGYGAGTQIGFTAQQVETVFPNWVSVGPDGLKGVGPKGFESLTVQALRELRAEKDAQIKKLQEENDTLKARLDDQQDRLAAIEKALGNTQRAQAESNLSEPKSNVQIATK